MYAAVDSREVVIIYIIILTIKYVGRPLIFTHMYQYWLHLYD